MFGYCQEKINVDHHWDLKGQRSNYLVISNDIIVSSFFLIHDDFVFFLFRMLRRTRDEIVVRTCR